MANYKAMDGEDFPLMDHVLGHWLSGSLMEAVDSKLQDDYDAEEVCLALKLGLLCSHPLASERPSIRQVVQYLDGGAAFPELKLLVARVIFSLRTLDFLSVGSLVR